MLNRRDLLVRLAATGLTLGTPNVVRRLWALDRTMLLPKRAWLDGARSFLPYEEIVDRIWRNESIYGTIILDGKRYPVVTDFTSDLTAYDTRLRLRHFEEDWNAPGMEIYDTLDD